jgi:hypothetical protein
MIVFHSFIGVPIFLAKDPLLNLALRADYNPLIYTRINSGLKKAKLLLREPLPYAKKRKIVERWFFLGAFFSICLFAGDS